MVAEAVRPPKTSLLLVVSAVALASACAACAAGRAEAGPPQKAQSAAPPSPRLIEAEIKDEPAEVQKAIREYYTKYEYRIGMRDGARLMTAVYVPKDKNRTYPFLMMRTPYSVGPYGVDASPKMLGPSIAALRAGFIFVAQDVRGRFQSEGEFVDMRPYIAAKKSPTDIDESSDAFDTIDWLVKNVAGHNGRFGVYGISYPGFYAAMAAIDAHPALKAASPQAPISDWFVGDDFHHNGALFLPHVFNFYAKFGVPRPELTKKRAEDFDHGTTDGYDFFLRLGPLQNVDSKYYKGKIAFWNDLVHHGDYDAFWKARNTRPHLRNIKPAVLTVGGFFDAEDLFGALATYGSIESQSPKSTQNALVMGPWRHGGWSRSDGSTFGDISFGAKTSKYYQEQIELPFFESTLKANSAAAIPEARVFETGTNEWKTYDAWPPKEGKAATLYLREGSKLAGTRAGASTSGAEAGDAYVSDPAKPVPYLEKQSVRMVAEYMIEDQRFAARRPDVLVYATEPLTEDVALAGPLSAELFVTTTGTDSDFVVKLVDVYPDDAPDPEPNPQAVHMAGYQELIRGEVFRGKYRNGFDKPEPFRPGEAARIAFTLPDVCHAFRTGHRLMVQVQSTWFPLVDRNPQTFVDIYSAKESDFHVATQRVLRSEAHPSSITVRIVRGTLSGVSTISATAASAP